MKTRITVVVLILAMAMPGPSHAFGILRYAYDAIANQLGLDRGPVPKALPRNERPALDPYGNPVQKPLDSQKLHIQAEGF